jgi:hypothetical protein
MDVIDSFNKYIKNIKIILIVTILFMFALYLVNPMFSLIGGSLDISYNLLLENSVNIIISLLSTIVLILAYTLIQTIIIYKIEDSYNFENYKIDEIKNSFFELTKFNIIFYVMIFLISAYLYSINFFNSFSTLILTIVCILFWYIPQIIVLEKEKTITAILINFNYIKRNIIHLLYLFVCVFILTFFTYFLDVLFNGFSGTIISTIFFVIFVIPFIEILKTETYLNKYNLLKPRW